MNSDLASLRGQTPAGLLGFLGRLVGLSMRSREWSGRDCRVYVSLDAFHASPAMARARLAEGRQVFVQDAQGRLLFVLGMPVPDPFPTTEDELCDLVDLESAATEPGSDWLQ